MPSVKSSSQRTHATAHLLQEALVEALRKVVRPQARLVVVHSNLGALGRLANPAADALRSLEKALPVGCTLAVPTFTLSFCRTGVYDVEETPGEVGLLGDTLRRQPGFRRTRHPIYSFAVRGPLAERILACSGSTCWGDGSFFELMEEVDADVVMVGCGWEFCTFFHRAEALARVPYRTLKRFAGRIRENGRDTPTAVLMWVRQLDPPFVNVFEPFASALRSNGLMRSAAAGKGLVEAAGAKDILREAAALLERNPFAVIEDAEMVKRSLKRLRVALLGSANLDIFAGHLQSALDESFREGSRVYVPPFGQYRGQLADDHSELRSFDPQWIVFAERIEDLLGPLLDDPRENPTGVEAALRERMEPYVEAIRRARQMGPARILVLGLDAPPRSPLGLSDSSASCGHTRITERANRLLQDGIEGLPDIHIVDYAHWRAAFGRGPSHDPKFWYWGRIPFSRDFSIYLGRRVSGVMLALAGRTARVILLDMDNILWGGIVGEDGLEGLQIGGDFPGNAYRDFQASLKALKSRGILLALCSKNTEDIALDALRRHPGMVLREEDFAARRINWRDKAENIAEIAAELSLGLSSFCFIDDDPHERQRIRTTLPEIAVPEWPEDPSQFASFLLELPCLEALELVPEDMRRDEQYKVRRQVEEARRRFDSPEAFRRSLGMTLFLESYGALNQARVLQLLGKTNQFNATTRRHGEADLDRFQRGGASIQAIGLQDVFSAREIIGVVIVLWPCSDSDTAVIDTLLLSCRVLGRGVETGVLGWVADEARRRGVGRLEGWINETDRNQPVRDVYARHGFADAGGGRHLLDVMKADLRVPDYLKLESEA